MPNEGNKILKYNHGEKSMKAAFTIYADLECLLQKMSTCHNNPEKSRTTKINKHTSSDYSLFTQYSFDLTKNMLDCYRGKDCMEKFCKDLKEHATQLIYCKKKKQMILMKKISLMKSKNFVTYAKQDLAPIMATELHSTKLHSIKGIIK